MPFLMEAGSAARIIRRGLERNRGRIAFPWQMYAAAWLVQALPTWTTDQVTACRRRTVINAECY